MDSQGIADALFIWYEKQGRSHLPWRVLEHSVRGDFSPPSIQKALRENPNIPYIVYLSEMMLQQTQVSAVLPYFERFLKHFPTLYDLAHGSEEEILCLWQGLGYYSRAKNLLKTAKICASLHNHTLPQDYDALRQLPGIGDYSAGAIACFGFGLNVSFWDGNIRRVLCRIFQIQQAGKKQLDALARKLLPPSNAYLYNQALLDLGALICKKFPYCNLCPISDFCLGKHNPQIYDTRKAKPYQNVALKLLLLQKDGRIGMFKDPRYNLLYAPLELACTSAQQGIFTPHGGAEKLNSKLRFLGSIQHTRTCYKITAKVYLADSEEILPAFPECLGAEQLEWIDPSKKPLSALAQKALKLLAP